MLKWLVLFLLTAKSSHQQFNFVFKPGPLVPATQGEVWPKPQIVEPLDDRYYTLLPSFFQFTNLGKTCKILEDALNRYRNIVLFNSRKIKQVYYTVRTCYNASDSNFIGYLTNFDVDLTGSCEDDDYPFFGMKEEYDLIVSRQVQKLTSSTIWGILRGLETFSQLIFITNDFSCHRVNTVSIRDYPRFAHRGFLLDTSRHYHTEENILALVDALSYNKFNVFHWHITDDYSFPYVSITFPELSKKGAFHPSLTIYRQDFVKKVIEYARLRGIRVMVEFDSPGHTLSWGLGNPDLLTKCYNLSTLDWGPMDPTKNSTYTFVFKLYEEIKQVFKDNYVHLGGDEVDFSCWQSNPQITKWMAENGISDDYPALQSYYTQKLVDYVTSLGLNSIVWEEVFTHGVNLPKFTIVNVWKRDDPQSVTSEVTAAGHRAIVSSYWYLDILSSGGDWLKFYNADPRNFTGGDEQKEMVIGGEACMWSEVVDSNNLESRVWPRASVAAEKFWSAESPPATTFPAQYFIAARLEEQTCRLNRRGIKAQPPTGPSICY